jgi:hypothetical protein
MQFARISSVIELVHRLVIDAHDAAFVFFEHAEHREPVLERAVESEDGLDRWAWWLEEKGDTVATPLRAMHAGEVPTTREAWCLEGINRRMHALGARFEMRAGLLRVAEITAPGLTFELRVLYVLLLRASLGLEDLTIDLALGNKQIAVSMNPPFFVQALWPAALRVLRIARCVYQPPVACVETV